MYRSIYKSSRIRYLEKLTVAFTVDNLIVRASCMFQDPSPETVPGVPLEPYYVTDRAAVTFDHTGRSKGSKAVYPLPPYFVEGQTISSYRQVGVSFEASLTPKGAVKASKGKGTSIQRRPVTLAVEPIQIGVGERQDVRWYYRIMSTSQTLLGLSSMNPPVHTATYSVRPNADTPESLRIKVDVIYRRKGILPRTRSLLPPKLRFLRDGAQHIMMTLETTIGKRADHCQFPGLKKQGGCELEMELEFHSGKIGQGPPEISEMGAV